jgi:hypothetical protein
MPRLIAAVGALALAVAGCSYEGLSTRERPGDAQSLYLYSLYEQMPPEAVNAPPPPLRLPGRVAVVQVGEAAPPAALIEALRADPAVFGRVESLPGIVHEAGFDRTGQRDRAPDASAQARVQVAGLRNLAADLGMDYLLLVGGTVDYGTSGTPLSLADLTIVGAFVVPSQHTRATARANGALVDVATGRVVVNSSAEAHRKSLVPNVSVDDEQARLLTKLRNDVVEKLGEQVLNDARLRATAFGNHGAGAAAPVPWSNMPASAAQR